MMWIYLDLDRDDSGALRVADLDGRVRDTELADVRLGAGEHHDGRDGGGIHPPGHGRGPP